MLRAAQTAPARVAAHLERSAKMNQSKTVSVIGALQAFEIVTGTLLVTAILKMNGYSQNAMVVWNPRAVWIRESGWILIGIPILWLAVSLLISNKEERIKSIIISGAVIFIGLLALYTDAIIHAFYRPIPLI